MDVIEAFVHRSVYGEREFDAYMQRRPSDRKTRTYGIIYLAFHGDADGLLIGKETFTLTGSPP